MIAAKRVLLAEDEPNIVASLQFLLERAGFDVAVVADGREALEQVRRDPPDVLVLDVMLPELDGYEVLRAIRADESVRATPVLMLTAKGQKQDRDTAYAAGADLFMSKPFVNAEITDAVARLANGKG